MNAAEVVTALAGAMEDLPPLEGRPDLAGVEARTDWVPPALLFYLDDGTIWALTAEQL